MRLLLLFIHLIIVVVTLFSCTAVAMSAPSSAIRTVMVTGANGYLASHIVKQVNYNFSNIVLKIRSIPIPISTSD